MNEIPRLFIYTADMVRISGKCERTCQRILQKMRIHFGLQKVHFNSEDCIMVHAIDIDEQVKK